MDQDFSNSVELGSWLKSDILTEFSDLLDEPIGDSFREKQPATLAPGDLLDHSSISQCEDVRLFSLPN